MKHSLVRRVLSLALSCGWPIHRFIVNNVFLHGTLSETIYCAQLTGLRTTLILIRYVSYGLKEAPRAWHSRFEVCFLSATVLQLNFVEAKSNTSMFMYHKDKDMVYLLYVEDSSHGFPSASASRQRCSSARVLLEGPRHAPSLGMHV